MHGIRRGIVAASVQEAVGGGFLKSWCVIMRHGPPASHATPSVCARGLHMPPPCKGMGLKPIGRALPGKRRTTSGRMFRDFKEQRGGALDP